MTRRPYRSPVRAQAAAVTRAAILDAAEALFAEHGYARVTIGRIAEEAGVAQGTVYAVFRTKPALVVGLAERASGDTSIDEDLEAVDAARSGGEIVDLVVRSTGRIVHRHGRTIAVLYDNASADPQVAEILRAMDGLLRERFQRIASRLEAVGGLREGMSAVAAARILEYYVGPESWRRLDRLGWQRDAARRWLAAQLGHALAGVSDPPNSM